ncbi:nucleotidyltransferase domain-containing protein [Candidatus Kryptobacter tengchongensis]|uniref:Nucleotidyltransferase domain-containing protein n=1 Tax=Kryptobacter tengchongensis TaxID=1643429 RepID=A0A916LID4_KRYT1|nr:nucleotidyltransferase domain-containing protein [Candidatus Kryptobacter tengchongensis]CUS97453.1 Nucleotidyltransferase domain-containing protein [Candidatus Kryptobacter tengchongensis]
MRQVISSGSVKGFYLKREEILKTVEEISKTAMDLFPEIDEIRIFGSFAKKQETGLSDIDIFVLLSDTGSENPIERCKKYFYFFADNLDIAVDVIVAGENEIESFRNLINESILVVKRTPKTNQNKSA